MSRYPDKELTKSFGSFETSVKLCQHALTNNSSKRYSALLSTLESSFNRCDEEWRLYKEEMMKKGDLTEDLFNKVEEVDGLQKPCYKYNDAWSNKVFEQYVTTRDLLLDELYKQPTREEKNQAADSSYDVEFSVQEINSDMQSIQSSISKLKADIIGHEDRSMAHATSKAYENIITRLRPKIETELKGKVLAKLAVAAESTDPTFSNQKIRANYSEFCVSQAAELEDCEMLLVRKLASTVLETGEAKPPISVPADTASVGVDGIGINYRPREQVYLEKTRPPKFNGDELEFPEFKRKWESQVSKAYLPEESELDKLRDALPKEAKDQLYGVVTLTEAWKILTQRYGDKLLISKKLKGQLKSIQCVGKSDPEKIINLKIKVRNLVTRLESLGMGAALTHDSEFLSAIYCALPDRHRVRWLDYAKGDDHWTSMLLFLDKCYEQANQELALLSVYKEDKRKDVKSAGVHVDSKSGSDDNNNERKEAKKKARESCGNCTICKQQHSWQRKDGSWWPSDRMLSCKKFKDMNIHQRAAAVESAKGCPRCTSWNLLRKDCKMKANSCGFILRSSSCQGDHSRLLHGTTNVYCAAVNTCGSSTGEFACVKEDLETVFFLQDIPVRKNKSAARVMWDKGSNRVLINESYAKKNNLISKDVT